MHYNNLTRHCDDVSRAGFHSSAPYTWREDNRLRGVRIVLPKRIRKWTP
jgi:hypothetical protein